MENEGWRERAGWEMKRWERYKERKGRIEWEIREEIEGGK